MLKSINQIDSEFSVYAMAHDQVHDYYFGTFLDACTSKKKILHSLMVVDTESANPVVPISGGSYTDVNLIITVCDKVYEDRRNEKDVNSDTFQIIQDTVNIMNSYRWRQWSRIIGTPQATPFRDKGPNAVDGWWMRLTLRVFSLRDLCAIPLNGYDKDGELSPNCAPVRIFADDVLVATIASGGFYSYTTSLGDVLIYNTDSELLLTISSPGNYTVPDSSVSVNGTGYDTLPATQNLDVTVINTTDAPVGVLDGPDWRIGNSVVTNSDDDVIVVIPAQQNAELADQSIEVFIDGVSQGIATFAAMTNPTIDIIWN